MTKDSRDALEDNGDGSQLQVKLISLPCNLDDRGFLYQIYGTYDSDLPEIRRVYIVGNPSRGIIRGFHRHEHESKAYFVISGSAKFVVINDVGSKATYTLSFRSPAILLIPPRHYHGWISLEDNTIVIGLSDKTLRQSETDDLREDPMKWGMDLWEVKDR